MHKGGVVDLQKKIGIYLLAFVTASLLSACSLKEGTEKGYKQETPLQIEVKMPKQFEAQKAEEITVVLSQAGNKPLSIQSISMDIWKQDSQFQKKSLPLTKNKNGVYTTKQTFDKEGLYFVKVHASTTQSTIMPTKQFIVGKLTDKDQEFLRKQAPEEQVMEHHHH
ncbi:MAG: FixH family protein [Bacillus sp. (in: firmicutes)]